ncbi:hypothetical protein [Mucilaginibacter lacusdianchii]|uniref:hypothetical protein n=1 Tax=Mucilaginibacter lacusdianchii TaxID=2684211 RepID=UPI00131D7B4B|nr:hypothetical protein [Mucilaginibacter sp. JXJ CY 39]
MEWSKLKKQLYFEDGSFRDIYILNTNESDWKKWVQYVNENYTVEFFDSRKDCSQTEIQFNVIQELWRAAPPDFSCNAVVTVGKTTVCTYFFSENEIENDILPSEFTSLDDHLALVKYMQDISTILGKSMVLSIENCWEDILMSVNKRDIELT